MPVIETFDWPIRLDSTGQVESRVLTAQFGDGYEQVAGEGINPDREEWQISVRGRAEVLADVYDFMKRHGMQKAFVWEPPFGEPGLFRRAAPIRKSGQGRGIFTLSTTFRQAFHP